MSWLMRFHSCAAAQGGITEIPVIAVPTSVGYGAAFGGLAPLLTMLNACSPGVGVVNIDNGFGAAVLAGKISPDAWFSLARSSRMSCTDKHSIVGPSEYQRGS